jgi:hypothetical protein
MAAWFVMRTGMRKAKDEGEEVGKTDGATSIGSSSLYVGVLLSSSPHTTPGYEKPLYPTSPSQPSTRPRKKSQVPEKEEQKRKESET